MAQKSVSKNTQWNVDVVEKGKTVYKAGKGQEVMVENPKTVPKAEQATPLTDAPKGVKDLLSNIFKKKK